MKNKHGGEFDNVGHLVGEFLNLDEEQRDDALIRFLDSSTNRRSHQKVLPVVMRQLAHRPRQQLVVAADVARPAAVGWGEMILAARRKSKLPVKDQHGR